MQKTMIVLATGLMAALGSGAQASTFSPQVWVSASLPFMVALAAVTMLITVSARPLTVSMTQLHRMPLTGLPRVSFFLTKFSLVMLMAVVALGHF